MVTVRVVEQRNWRTDHGCQIRLGAYRAETDQNGQAQINSAKGTFELNIWKVGYDAPPERGRRLRISLFELMLWSWPEDDYRCGLDVRCVLHRFTAHEPRLRSRRRDALAHGGAAQGSDLFQKEKTKPPHSLRGKKIR